MRLSGLRNIDNLMTAVMGFLFFGLSGLNGKWGVVPARVKPQADNDQLFR